MGVIASYYRGHLSNSEFYVEGSKFHVDIRLHIVQVEDLSFSNMSPLSAEVCWQNRIIFCAVH